MNHVRDKGYNSSAKKNYNKKEGNTGIEYVTLPYDFVPLAEKENRYFPYTKNSIPKHNQKEKEQLSGVITYRITPYSDLAIEVRQKWNGGYFIIGSQIRGRVRTNLEILSASYPEFIDRSPLLYREVDNDNYRKKIAGGGTGKVIDIERSIQVGFLRKIGNEFYVIPAQRIGDKNFLSIKEHRLMQMQSGNSQALVPTLYDWGDKETLKKLNKLQFQIDQKTKQIRVKRKELKDVLNDGIQSEISKIFTPKYNFNKKLALIRRSFNKDNSYDYQPDLENIKNELLNDLRSIKYNDFKIEEIFQLTAERWRLKAEIDLIYTCYMKNKKNKNSPYQKEVFFKRTANNGIEKISLASSEDTPENGYLFNSTNATSKRSHYFVMNPVKENIKEYLVPQAVINGYNRNLKRFRTTTTEIKEFYDIFDQYDVIINRKRVDATDGLIVFFNTWYNPKTNEKEIANIGRTPYFKIAHRTQLADILGEKEADKVDYANALFGFIPDDQEGENLSSFTYKSRLRFSSADIVGAPIQHDVHDLVLMTPCASASAMYLQQPDDMLRTYEDENVKLNGYKYYHVLKQPLRVGLKNKGKTIVSSRKLLKHEGIHIIGRIYFHNISKEELGLLLLSLDWKELRQSKKYGKYIAAYEDKLENAYELIGGAKPYGYGKVKIKVQDLQIEKEGNDFEVLVSEPMEQIREWHEYIDAFITSMGGQQYFERVYFKQYIQSKIEI